MTIQLVQTQSEDFAVDTGVESKDRRKLATSMGRVLASSYVLYHKIHAFHWNVTGPMFYSVHKLTDDHYQDLAAALDNIAERIRAIGFKTPTGLKSYLSESVVEDVDEMPAAEEMIKQLSKDHQAIAMQLREAVKEAETLDDVFTADLLTARIGAHEEASWMLNALVTQ